MVVQYCSNIKCSFIKNAKGNFCPMCGSETISPGFKEELKLMSAKKRYGKNSEQSENNDPNIELNKINAEIVLWVHGSYGNKKGKSRTGTAELTDNELILTQFTRFGKKVHKNVYINYKDIEDLQLSNKGTFRKAYIKIHANTTTFTIEKYKSEKLTPFFENLRSKVSELK